MKKLKIALASIIPIAVLLGCQTNLVSPATMTIEIPRSTNSVLIETSLPKETASVSSRKTPISPINATATSAKMSRQDLPTHTTSPSPILQITATPTFEPITEGNIQRLTLKMKRHVHFYALDLDCPDCYQLIIRPDALWFADSFSVAGIEIIDVNTKEKITELVNGEQYEGELVVSPNNRYLASFSEKRDSFSLRTINIWDLDTLQIVKTFPYPSKRNAFPPAGIYSENNRYLAVSGCAVTSRWACLSALILVYDLHTSEKVLEVAGKQKLISKIKFSPDNRFIFITGDGESIRNADLLVWDLKENKRVFEASADGEDAFYDMELSPDGSLVLAFSNSCTVYAWGTQKWETFGKIMKKTCGPIVFIPKTNIFLAFDYGENLVLADAKNGKMLTTKLRYDGMAKKIVVSSDSRFLYMLDHNGWFYAWGIAK